MDAKLFVVITPQARGVSRPLGLFDNHDADGERLYGTAHGTLFFSRKDAREAAKVWPHSRVVQVTVRPVEDPQ